MKSLLCPMFVSVQFQFYSEFEGAVIGREI